MSIEQIISPFYTKLPEESFRKELVLGQFCWVPIGYLYKIPFVLEVERADPQEVYISKFRTVHVSEQHFRGNRKLPIKGLSLRLNEELLVTAAKRRPCIVVCNSFTTMDELTERSISLGLLPKYLLYKPIVVVPVYGIKNEHRDGGFPPEVVARVKVFMYNQFFYLPSYRKMGFEEGIARLDRLNIIIPDHNRAVCDPMPFALSEDALGILLAMLRSLFGSIEEPELEALKEILKESLPQGA